MNTNADGTMRGRVLVRNIPIPAELFPSLTAMADEEFREPKLQASMLIVEGVRRWERRQKGRNK